MNRICLSCGEPTDVFLDLGLMPVANRFASADDQDDYRFRLAVARCPSCHLVQITDPIERERMFHDGYAYYSSTSRRMVQHFADWARWLGDYLPVTETAPFVVELGSNDGILLRALRNEGMRPLGIEPSANVAQVAIDDGLPTEVVFFDKAEAIALRNHYGHADAICGANVLCHLPYLSSVLDGVTELLTEDGLFIFEDPYLPNILEKAAFDQIYDEHTWYFTATAVSALASRHDLVLVDALPQETHGGSMRYVLAREGGRHQQSLRVKELLNAEHASGLHTQAPYEAFGRRVRDNASAFRALLDKLRQEGHRVMGYGATAKSATVLNYCGITPKHIESICDITPIKQGCVTPGTGIPVVPHGVFAQDPPAYTVLFAWNHAEEILSKEREYSASGGRWITYIPEVEVT